MQAVVQQIMDELNALIDNVACECVPCPLIHTLNDCTCIPTGSHLRPLCGLNVVHSEYPSKINSVGLDFLEYPLQCKNVGYCWCFCHDITVIQQKTRVI